MNQQVVLVTGAAGFIGYHLCQRLLNDGCQVVGVDNLNSYYEVSLKLDRLSHLKDKAGFRFLKLDISNRGDLDDLFSTHRFSHVVHLAAQAGVRYSLENPQAYVDSNLVGFVNILELVRNNPVQHFVYASSSSVYGDSKHVPFSEDQNVDCPISLYAATKKSNELIAHVYSHLFRIPTTGLRFFTVYGPWGRPDMAISKFTRAILAGEPIEVYNNGEMWRDFTFIDDIVEGVVRVMHHAPDGNDAPPYRIFNIGNNKPVQLMNMIRILERCLGRSAEVVMRPMQPGDVHQTFADVDALAKEVGYTPVTEIEMGLQHFVTWYNSYYEPKVHVQNGTGVPA